MLASSRVTQKYQTTIPAAVRKVLGIKSGDLIGFDAREGGEIVIRKTTPLDVAFAKSVEGTLSEWASKEDEEAYRDL